MLAATKWGASSKVPRRPCFERKETWTETSSTMSPGSSGAGRRAALVALLGAAVLGTDPDAALARRKGRGRRRVSAAAADRCFPGTNCTPGAGKNTARCDFAFSTVFRNKDVRGSNLSRSSFAGADLRGADFRGANLSGGCFASANLTGPNWVPPARSGRGAVAAGDDRRLHRRRPRGHGPAGPGSGRPPRCSR